MQTGTHLASFAQTPLRFCKKERKKTHSKLVVMVSIWTLSREICLSLAAMPQRAYTLVFVEFQRAKL